jgi:hypothetical protein
MSRYRHAMAAYVRGHDRVWPVELMRGGAPPHDSPPEVEWGAVSAPPSIGVGVASSLEFHSGPGSRRAVADGAGHDD